MKEQRYSQDDYERMDVAQQDLEFDPPLVRAERTVEPPASVTVWFCAGCDWFWTQGAGGRSSAWRRCEECGKPCHPLKYELVLEGMWR